MATYGKKKRNLVPSSFAVFQDDQLRPKTSSKLSVPARIERARTVMQRSRARQRPEDDSMDELAGDSLLRNRAREPMRASFQSDAATSEFARPTSHRTAEKDLDKPLPPIPLNEEGYQQKSKPALTIKTTNFKILKKSEKPEKPPLRPKISYPVLQDSEDNDNNSALRQVNGSNEPSTSKAPTTTTEDAELLNKKITSIMQQASAREAQQTPKTKELSKADWIVKPSPLQKSRNAFSKATRAITGRFNSSRRPTTPNVRKPGPIESSPSSFKALEYTPEPRSRSATVERRIAEGGNLSNPKIQGITGGGSIPRKPLPVYESMKSLRRLTGSLDDPFSDGNRTESIISPEMQAGFDFNFNKRKGKAKGAQMDQDTLSTEETPADNNTTTSTDVPRPLKFPRKISGLSEHPNTMAFSSPPIGFSTPRIRLEPPPDPNKDNKANGALKNSPSILEFSFEESESDEISGDHEVSDATDHSMNVKRKSAKNDLRSQLSPPASKRLRRSQDTSRDELTLEDEFRQLDTNDKGVLLDEIKATKRSLPNTANRQQRDTSNHQPLTSIAGVAKRSRARATAAKRTLIPRPNSIMFSRESRAHFRLRDTTDGATMDIDELQMDGDDFNFGAAEKN
ncbi:MAG: hypothetical protein Q9191_002832 [Dirinaria sp. TL-2023a]